MAHNCENCKFYDVDYKWNDESDIGYENLQPTMKDISNGWKRTYQTETIEKYQED